LTATTFESNQERSCDPSRSLLVAAATALLGQSATYRITYTYTLGGDGRWEHIVPDSQNHRLLIAGQNRVMVVDDDAGTLLGEVTGPHHGKVTRKDRP
jgi:hypothetical protein